MHGPTRPGHFGVRQATACMNDCVLTSAVPGAVKTVKTVKTEIYYCD